MYSAYKSQQGITVLSLRRYFINLFFLIFLQKILSWHHFILSTWELENIQRNRPKASKFAIFLGWFFSILGFKLALAWDFPSVKCTQKKEIRCEHENILVYAEKRCCVHTVQNQIYKTCCCIFCSFYIQNFKLKNRFLHDTKKTTIMVHIQKPTIIYICLRYICIKVSRTD